METFEDDSIGRNPLEDFGLYSRKGTSSQDWTIHRTYTLIIDGVLVIPQAKIRINTDVEIQRNTTPSKDQGTDEADHEDRRNVPSIRPT